MSEIESKDPTEEKSAHPLIKHMAERLLKLIDHSNARTPEEKQLAGELYCVRDLVGVLERSKEAQAALVPFFRDAVELEVILDLCRRYLDHIDAIERRKTNEAIIGE